MKNYKSVSTAFITAVLLFGFTITAFANSSWVWISEARPYDVLPFVIVGTLLIETAAANLLLKVGNWHKVFVGTVIGNLMSFAVPYIGYSNTTPYAGYYTLAEILNRGPFYTVGGAFLLTTILVELPFMCFWLKKDVTDKKKLILVTVLANVVTTTAVAIVERIFCQGHYA